MYSKSIIALAVLAVLAPSLASAQYGGGGGGGYSAPEPTISPLLSGSVANFSINNGAKVTQSTKVTLTLPSTNADQVTFSNFPDFKNSSWENYSSTKEWILSPEAGQKTVYVMFRISNTGKTSKVLSNTIDLEATKVDGKVVAPVLNTSETVQSPPAQTTPTSNKYVFKKYLNVGSRGVEVKQLQQTLKDLGYFTYPTITGFYGAITKAAVVKFQKERNLKPFPGWVGPATRKALNS